MNFHENFKKLSLREGDSFGELSLSLSLAKGDKSTAAGGKESFLGGRFFLLFLGSKSKNGTHIMR